jgi:Zn-dependent peptidase ImmA (M78 family)
LLFCGKNDVCNFANDALNPERQADGFASHLILPTYMVDPRLRKMKRLTLAAGRELADEFCTSLRATLFKMTVLNRFPMTIVPQQGKAPLVRTVEDDSAVVAPGQGSRPKCCSTVNRRGVPTPIGELSC